MPDPASLLGAKFLAVAAWLALLFALERVRPAAPPPRHLRDASAGWHRLGRNGGFWLINAALSPLVVVPLTALAAGAGPGLRPAWWGGWPGLVADLLLLDGLIYWWHRANHEIPILWRFHAVHHLDRFLDSTTALRFHFGEVLLSALARAAVIVLIGFPLASVLAFETLLLAATIFHHSNVRLPPRLEAALARLVVTPSIHWVHHHARQTDTDANYATVLSLWDRVFGSVSPTRRAPDMPIGIEGRGERRFLDLVLEPFRPARPAA